MCMHRRDVINPIAVTSKTKTLYTVYILRYYTGYKTRHVTRSIKEKA